MMLPILPILTGFGELFVTFVSLESRKDKDFLLEYIPMHT